MSDSEFNFIVDNIRFSFSSTTTFENCAYSFKLTYIDTVPRVNNFYGEFGTFIHECYERYFSGELDSFELSEYYRKNYHEFVKSDAPVPPFGLGERYKREGQDYFDNFSFEKEKYNVTSVEDTIHFLLNGVTFTARPDLILQDKETEIYHLYDFKTSAPFRIDKRNGKEIEDKKKIEGYEKQLYLYAYALRNHRDIPIEKLVLMFPRLNRNVYFDWNQERETEVLEWISVLVDKIKTEKDFPYNNSNKYFCHNLCSVRDFCQYR